eukprot:285934-Prymnesium_polylepis.1
MHRVSDHGGCGLRFEEGREERLASRLSCRARAATRKQCARCAPLGPDHTNRGHLGDSMRIVRDLGASG